MPSSKSTRRMAAIAGSALLLAGCCSLPMGGSSDVDPSSSSSSQGATDGSGAAAPATKAPADKPTLGARPMKEQGGVSGLINAAVRKGMPPAPEPGISRGQCNDLTDGGPVDEHGITGRIECGETVVGHTRGGVQAFNTRWYEQNFCTPATTNHDGGDERIYRLRLPDGKQRAFVTLDTPCADLDVSVIQWDRTELPAQNASVSECDMRVEDGTRRELVEAVSDGSWRDWLVVVEGKDSEEGAFSLTVQCVNHL